MIFVRDKGRMCNNILQYGHVYAWAREHGRQSVSMRFSYKYQYFNICSTPFHNFFTYIYAKSASAVGLLPVATFNNDNGNLEAMRLLETKRNLVVQGWAVRFYDLFLKYRNEITTLFAFKQEIKASVERLMDTTSLNASVRLGVHIRRGDYKTWQDGRFYYDDSVYIDHIRQFVAMQGGCDVTVYVCGNDPSLDKSRYEAELKSVKVVFPDGNPAEDLCLLSECDYLIGAPSTFSLVAAMYRDVPLCWIKERGKTLSHGDFDKFEYLFRHIE